MIEVGEDRVFAGDDRGKVEAWNVSRQGYLIRFWKLLRIDPEHWGVVCKQTSPVVPQVRRCAVWVVLPLQIQTSEQKQLVH